MRKLLFVVIIICGVLLFMGCDNQPRQHLEVLINQSPKNQDIYTTVSYNDYLNAYNDAKKAYNNPFSSRKRIEKAQIQLQSSIDNLGIASDGIYRIEYKFTLKSNDSVGNDWKHSVKYTNQELNNGDSIKAPIASEITLDICVVEDDIVLDISTIDVVIALEDEVHTTKLITVYENQGQYNGCSAVWQVDCYITLIERV